MAVDDLDALCHDLLDACEDLLAPTVGGTPGRTFVSPGEPALDCDQLTVHCAAVTEEVTSPVAPPAAPGKRSKYRRINLATLIVTVARCVQTVGPSGSPPTVTALEAGAKKTDQDVWGLWNGIMSKWRAGDLFGDCGTVHFDGAVILPTQGNIAAWTITLRVSLNGYNTEGP